MSSFLQLLTLTSGCKVFPIHPPSVSEQHIITSYGQTTLVSTARVLPKAVCATEASDARVSRLLTFSPVYSSVPRPSPPSVLLSDQKVVAVQDRTLSTSESRISRERPIEKR